MASAFISQVFGFGMKNEDIDWERVNEHRQGKKYVNEAAAKEVLAGKADKTALMPDTNPFVKTFGVGINYEGYWNHHQMSVQL